MVKRNSRRRSLPFRVLILSSVMLPILFAIPTGVPLAHAQTNGLLYVAPTTQGPFAAGTTLTYQVKVSGMDTFNGWDVSVITDASVLAPQSIDTTGNLFEASFSSSVIEVVNCPSGVGTGCDINDGPGVAHSSAVSSGASATAGSSGLLFTITYQVVGGGTSSLTIHPGFDIIFNGASSVSHSTAGASYGAPPSFTITANPSSLTISPKSFGTSIITVQSIGGFAGVVNLTATVPATPRAPSAVLVNSTNFIGTSLLVTVSAGGASMVTLNVTTLKSTPLVSYPVNVTGTSGTLTAQTIVTVTLVNFTLSASPRILPLKAGQTGTFTITATGLNGFTGNVALSITVHCDDASQDSSACLATSLSQTSISLSSTSTSGTAMLVVSIPQGTHKGTFTITITGASGSLVHVIRVRVMSVHHIDPTHNVDL